MRKRQALRQPVAGKRPKAATSDVLSASPKKTRIDPKWESNFRNLRELQAHLLRHRGTLVQDANEEQPTFSEHMADAGTDSYDRDFALGKLSSDQNALYEIEEAIQRIENCTYGICESSGKPIQRRRLDAIPWTRFTLEVEQQLEQRGAFKRTRLGNLGSVTATAPPLEVEEPEVPQSKPASEE